MPHIERLVVMYDPFVHVDHAHALRLEGPMTERYRLHYTSHNTVREVVLLELWPDLMQMMVDKTKPQPHFWQTLRSRRWTRKWSRYFIESIPADKHPKLLMRSEDQLIAHGDFLFAKHAKDAVLEAHPHLREPEGNS